MMNFNMFLKMARWARNPPSEDRVKLYAAILIATLALFAVEYFVGWPDWMQVNNTPKGKIN
jgi:hypothetical protein